MHVCGLGGHAEGAEILHGGSVIPERREHALLLVRLGGDWGSFPRSHCFRADDLLADGAALLVLRLGHGPEESPVAGGDGEVLDVRADFGVAGLGGDGNVVETVDVQEGFGEGQGDVDEQQEGSVCDTGVHGQLDEFCDR